MAFKKRTKAPAKSEKWFYKSNPFYLAGYGLPNCTAYAWGRFAELLGKAPKLSRSNAENWYGHKDGYKRGKKPKLGAVIVWAKGKVGVGSDGAGHVAVVEEIYSDGSFLVSESGWKASKIMWTKKIPASCYRAGYRFLGFIYNPAVSNGSKPTKPTYEVGKTYTVKTALKVRKSAGTSGAQLKRSELTADAKKNSYDSALAVLKPETLVTVQKVSSTGGEIWLKIPSGWVCAKMGKDYYVG